MPLARTKLIDYLSEVAPALSQDKMSPVLSHFWFTGKELMAYAGRIAISLPFKSEFTGAISPTLLPLLKSSKAKEVDLSPDDKNDTLLVKAASSKFKLSMIPASEFTFKMPASKDGVDKFPVDAPRFLQAIKECMKSVGYDTSNHDYTGVTMLVQGKYLRMFATDRATFSTARVPITEEVEFERVLLGAEFCRELLRIFDGATEIHLEVHEKYVIAQNRNVTLWGLLEQSENPIPYLKIVEDYLPGEYKANLAEIPTKLANVLERATVITESAVDKTDTLIAIKDGVIKFSSQSDRGEVHDTMTVGDAQKNCRVTADPKRVLDGVTYCKSILFTDKCIAMRKDQYLYMVGVNEA